MKKKMLPIALLPFAVSGVAFLAATASIGMPTAEALMFSAFIFAIFFIVSAIGFFMERSKDKKEAALAERYGTDSDGEPLPPPVSGGRGAIPR